LTVLATDSAPAAASLPSAVPSFLELEITQFCQLRCSHCYSHSGPEAGRGTMTPADWQRLIDQAAAIGIRTVQFIGGEPTLDPDMPALARYALHASLNVDIYTNLVHVTPELWDLFTHPRVSVGFSWYSADPATHGQVTGSTASYARTKANVTEAVRRGVRLTAGVVEVIEGQDTAAAIAQLRELGVTQINTDRVRGVGRAAHGTPPAISELCGQCGKGRAAIGMDGQLTPCVIGRFLVAGNVRDTPLAELFAGPRWHEIIASVPERDVCVTCTPADSNDCNPSRKPA
jgi:MoaA/NifB/PqqE/SkfB family radical SAM enzyme